MADKGLFTRLKKLFSKLFFDFNKASTSFIVLTASSTSVEYDLGITSVDADIFVDGHDATSTGHAQFDAIDATAMLTVGSTADTLDLLVGGAQDTAGKIRVWAIMCDISGVDETDRN